MTIDSPANARSRRTRDALLSAARTILENNGSESLTMTAVAELAGVTRRAVYLHFPSRAELVFSLVDYVAEQEGLEDSLRPVFSAPTAADALDQWARHLARCHYRLLPVLRAVENAPESDLDVARYSEKARTAQWESCALLTARLQQEGLLAQSWTLESATDMLWALGDLVRTLRGLRRWSEDDFVAHVEPLLRSTFVEGSAR